MTVYIRSEKFRLFLLFPTRLLCSRAIISVVGWALRKGNIETGLSQEEMVRAAKQICACKKYYKKINLVEVVTAQGEKVIVRL